MDKLSKQILERLIHEEKGPEYICSFGGSLGDIDIKNFSDELKCSSETVKSAVRFLHERGYLEYQTLRNDPIGFHLSHMGLNYKYFRRQEILKYVADKWIDFFALLLSVAALVTSIISLLLK